jgi:hypothetical protein
MLSPVADEVAALPSAEIIPYTADLPGAQILEYSMTRQFEYWGSTKKFITVPVGRVHTLPEHASRQTCMDCSLNSGWKSATQHIVQAGVALEEDIPYAVARVE